jgi:hypothetical protein
MTGLGDGDVLELAGLQVEVRHTPGHTPGHCCFYAESMRPGCCPVMGPRPPSAASWKSTPFSSRSAAIRYLGSGWMCRTFRAR